MDKEGIGMFKSSDQGITAYAHLTPENELVNKFPIEKTMNTIAMIDSGILEMEECLLSLK